MSASDDEPTRGRTERLRRRLRWLSGASCVFTGTVACVILIGWAVDRVALIRIVPFSGAGIMTPLAAVGLALAATALALLKDETAPFRQRLAGRAAAAGTLAIGALVLAERGLGADLGIDLLLFPEAAQRWTDRPPGRPTSEAAWCFLLIGAALLTLELELGRRRRPAQLLAIVVAFLGLVTLTGYGYGQTVHLGSTSWWVPTFDPMATHTAVAFTSLAAGILFARPEHGVMAVFTGADAGGYVARRLLPVAVVVPLVLGWFRLAGERADLFTPEFGTALFVVSVIGVLTGVIGRSTSTLKRLDEARAEADAALRDSEARFRAVFERAGIGITLADPRGVIVACNAAFAEMLGYAQGEIRGLRFTDITHPDHLTADVAAFRTLVDGERDRYQIEKRYLLRRGHDRGRDRAPAGRGGAAAADGHPRGDARSGGHDRRERPRELPQPRLAPGFRARRGGGRRPPHPRRRAPALGGAPRPAGGNPRGAAGRLLERRVGDPCRRRPRGPRVAGDHRPPAVRRHRRRGLDDRPRHDGPEASRGDGALPLAGERRARLVAGRAGDSRRGGPAGGRGLRRRLPRLPVPPGGARAARRLRARDARAPRGRRAPRRPRRRRRLRAPAPRGVQGRAGARHRDHVALAGGVRARRRGARGAHGRRIVLGDVRAAARRGARHRHDRLRALRARRAVLRGRHGALGDARRPRRAGARERASLSRGACGHPAARRGAPRRGPRPAQPHRDHLADRRDVARGREVSRALGGPARRRALGRPREPPHRGPARRGADAGGPALGAHGASRDRAARRRDCCAAPAAGRGQEDRLRRRGGRGTVRHRGRPRPPPPGLLEPDRQRDPLHAGGWAHRGPRRARRGARALLGLRHGARHPPGSVADTLRPVLAGVAGQPPGRRPRPRHREGPRRGARPASGSRARRGRAPRSTSR